MFTKHLRENHIKNFFSDLSLLISLTDTKFLIECILL